MMRALYTSATGMIAQQFHMDVVANNLANVNTVGFKKSRADFQDLLYQTLRPAGATVAEGAQVPAPLEVGLGVRPVTTVAQFTPGSLEQTGNPLDVAISGNGFFKIQTPQGVAYTRDGSFKLDSQGSLVSSDGYKVLPDIRIPDGAQHISIGPDGTVTAVPPGQTEPSVVGQITLARFANPAGLSHMGGNAFAPSAASGTPTEGTPGNEGLGSLMGNTLEMSNVQIVEEMVAMITAQRAYEVNSKSIQTADDMLSTANNLKR
jgi:flagellar basal-body rod protein FlgG